MAKASVIESPLHSEYLHAVIRDLEDQLLRVPDASIREFLAEAVRCYHTGSYRASVVQAVAAGIHDLRLKLLSIVQSHGAPASLKTSVTTIEGKYGRQEPIEQDVINAAEKDAGFLTPAEAKSCRALLLTRHLCAHPSGHRSSPEEARDAITKVVDIILAKPALMGMVAIDELLQRLASPTFFPKATTESQKEVVEAEIKTILPDLFPALASQLLRALYTEATKPSPTALPQESQLRVNTRSFLSGLTQIGGSVGRALWSSRAMVDLACRPEVLRDVLEMLRVDVSMISVVDELSRARLLASIRHNLELGAAQRAAGALLNSEALRPEESEDIYLACHAVFIDRWPSSVETLVLDIGYPRLTEAFVDSLIARCGSSTFDIANAAIPLMQALPARAEPFLTASRLLTYLENVSKIAKGLYPSRKAAALLDSGMGKRADAIDALVQAVGTSPEALRASRANWLAVADLMCASGRASAVVPVLNVVREELLTDWETARGLSKHSDASISSFGTALLSDAKKRWADTEGPA